MNRRINFQAGPTASAMNSEGIQNRMIRAGLDPVEQDLKLNEYYDYLVENGASPEKIQRELLNQLDAVIRREEAQILLRARIGEFGDGALPF